MGYEFTRRGFFFFQRGEKKMLVCLYVVGGKEEERKGKTSEMKKRKRGPPVPLQGGNKFQLGHCEQKGKKGKGVLSGGGGGPT